jgi:hypothetical protein
MYTTSENWERNHRSSMFSKFMAGDTRQGSTVSAPSIATMGSEGPITKNESEAHMDTWRRRIEKKSLGRQRSRELTIFPKAGTL